MFFSLLLIYSVFAQNLRIYVPKEISSFDEQEVISFYLGETEYYQGKLVRPALFFKEKKDVNIICRKFFSMSKRQFDSLWRKKVYAGSFLPPYKFSNKEDLLKHLKSEKMLIISLENVEGLLDYNVQSKDL